MFKFRSLTSKIIFVSAILLLFLAVFIYMSFEQTHRLKDEATRINLAGQLRFRSFEIAWRLQELAEGKAKESGSQQHESQIEHIKQKIGRFEQIISDLKEGNIRIGLKPMPHKEHESALKDINDEWSNNLKPLLLAILELPAEAKEKDARVLLNKYGQLVYAFVHGKADNLVRLIEENYKTELKRYDLYRFYALGFLFIATVFMVLYLRKNIIMPLLKLTDAAREIEKGNFDARVDIKGEDEIGKLGITFNSMAGRIGKLADEQTRHVNELVRAEDTSRRTAANLANAQKIAHLGNWDWDMINNTLLWSDEIYRIFGMKAEEFVGAYEAFFDCVHPDDREFVKESVNRALYGKKPYNIDHRIILPDGSEKIVHEQAEVTFDENGKPIRMFGTVQDITERKKAEEDLRKSEERFRKLVESVTNYIYTVKVENGRSVKTTYGPGCESVTGYTPEEYEADPYLWYRMIYKDDRDVVAKLTDKLLSGDAVQPFEHRLSHKDGSIRWVGNSPVLRFDEHHRLIAYDGLITDITARKKAEEKIIKNSEDVMALAEASNVILTTTTTKNLYETVCDIAVRKFGLKLSSLALIEKSGELNPVAEADSGGDCLAALKIGLNDPLYRKCPIVTAIKTKTPQVLNDLIKDPCPGPCGGKIALDRGCKSLIMSPLIDTNGELIGVIGFCSSETGFFTSEKIRLLNVYSNYAASLLENRLLIEGLEQKVKDRTQELEIAKLQAEAANKAKSDFLANMSHELRTPLNSIIGFSEVLGDGMAGTVTDDQKEYLKDIWESGKHLLRLINDILDLSKVEAGKMELELSEFDVKELIDGCLILFKEKAMRHSIKLSEDIPDDIGSIEADERKIKQVILNLLGNAFKFTPDGGSVRVSARRVRSSELGVRRLPPAVE